METFAGKALWEDIRRQGERPQGKSISQMILREFDERPGGIILPHGLVAKRFDGRRVLRVIHKIVRGLFYYETNRLLHQLAPMHLEIYTPRDEPSKLAKVVSNAKSRAVYTAIFDYKYQEYTKAKGYSVDLQAWALLLWDHLIFLASFHDPACTCDDCRKLGGAGAADA